jgi:predicted nucleic acid-binding protein
MIYCIDAHLAIWGIKKQATPSQVEMIEKTERFFEHASKHKIDILIPAPVITEILAIEPVEKHAAYLKEIQKGFIVVDMDVRIAKKTAELMYDKMPNLKEYLSENNVARDKMKIDHIIAATAMVYKVDMLFSYDKHLKQLCDGIVNISSVPNIPKETVKNPLEQQLIFSPMKVAK